MVPVPEALDPAKGIVSLSPYQDQNDWRWSYLFQLIEVWTYCLHQTDGMAGLMLGGIWAFRAIRFPAHTAFTPTMPCRCSACAPAGPAHLWRQAATLFSWA